jgi:serine/threonine protein kinase
MLTPNALVQHRYLITQQVGDSTSAVFEAFDLATRVPIAIKQVRIQASQREPFERAARRLWGLRHPNLPAVQASFAEQDRAFLAMDLLPGDDLAASIERSGKPFEIERVERWANQLLDALDYIHTLQPPLFHGGINPRNLKLKSGDQIVLLGFDPPQGPSEAAAGNGDAFSAQFLAPERAAGADARGDLFALAATLYYLLTGTPPMAAKEPADTASPAHLGPARPAHALNSRVPAGLSAAIMQALTLDPAQRPSSAAGMRAIIKQRAPPPRRRLSPAIIAVALAAAIVAMIWLGNSFFANRLAREQPPTLPTNQIGGAATSLPAPTVVATADVVPTASAQPITSQETSPPGPSPSAIAAPTSIIVPEVDSIEPQQLFTGTLPLTMAVRGVGLDQVRMAQLVADGRPPIELTRLTSSAELLTLKIGAPSEPLNGEAHYRIQLDGAIQGSPEIILRDFVEQTTIQGVEAQYTYTERVAVDGAGAYTRMRATPNIDSQPIGLLRNGDQLDILRIDIPAWYLVRYNTADGAGQIGWLERWLVEGREAPAAPSPTPTPAPLVFAGRVYSTPTDSAVQCGTSLFESSIYGSVENSAGRGISGAVLRITSVDGRNVFRATTTRGGVYSVPNLGCTKWTVRLISVPNAPGGIRVNVVTVSNLNGGKFTSAEVRFRMQR